MILDIDYSKAGSKLTISYVNERGNKAFLETNIKKFKTYGFEEGGEFENWDGRRCGIRYTDRPSKFDIKTYINELPTSRQDLLFQKKFPNLYTFDIETEYNPAEKADPRTAKFPITTISICSPDMTTLVLGFKEVKDVESIENKYNEYLSNNKVFNELELKSKFVYKKFDNEKEMLHYFLKNIVAKCTVLAGWNIWGFDWQYIQNRLANYYPDISIRNSSSTFKTKNKRVPGFFNKEEFTTLQIPQHTLLVDMMDVIMEHDSVVLPMKESMSLDWISKNSIGAQKVEYDGSLADLYEKDFDTYVFYNAIDSALVQLIDKHFKTMQLIYIYSNITKLGIGDCFGKISVAEALFFEEFYKNDLKVVWEKKNIEERGKLHGAYVKNPTPGRYNYALCFDFAGLYPSQVMTCNLSVENFIHPPQEGWSEEQINNFKRDPNYFVSLTNNVYKNDKDYAFKRIQIMLRENRNKTKYMAKYLDAQVMSQIDDYIDGVKIHDIHWSDVVKEYMNNTYNVSCIEDIISLGDVEKFKQTLKGDITYKIVEEMAFKLVGNSCYGGSSHVNFFWVNIDMANDITGESRNLFHMMDDLTNKVLLDEFADNIELHKLLGVEIDRDKFKKEVSKVKDAVVYGDTDSNYVVINHLVQSIRGVENMSDTDKTKFCVDLAEKYLNNLFNTTLSDYFETRHVKSIHNFELETVAKTGIWINRKKRYAQAILWKDGRYYDNPQIKIKGLEIVKSSTPVYSRKILKDMMNILLLDESDNISILHKLNNISQTALKSAPYQPVDDLTISMSVNGYAGKVIKDKGGLGPEVSKGTPFNVSALALYNWFVNTYNYPDDNIYGGKVKLYIVNDRKKRKGGDKERCFAYMAEAYPKWAPEKAPMNYGAMHSKTILDPINRILGDIGMQELCVDGSLTMNLFGDLFG